MPQVELEGILIIKEDPHSGPVLHHRERDEKIESISPLLFPYISIANTH
jgi:hypothetical protein